MSNLVDFIVDIIENAIITSYLVHTSRLNSRYQKWKAILQISITSVLLFIMNHYIYYEGILMILYILEYFAFLMLNAADPWYMLLANSFIPFLCILLINLPLAAFTAQVILPLFPSLAYADIHPVLVVISKILLVLLLWFISSEKKKIAEVLPEKMQKKIIFIYLLFFIIMAFSGYALFSDTEAVHLAGYTSAMFFACSLLVAVAFAMSIKIAEMQKNEQMLQEENRMIQLQLKDQKKLMESNSRMEQERHSMKHILKTVKAELKNESNASKTIDKELAYINSIKKVIITGNDVVDYFVNDAYEQADEMKIDFICNIAKDFELQIPDEELGIILGNLFDNAIENCAGDNKTIRCSMHPVNHYLRIEIANTTDKADTEEPDLESHKLEKGHGYGIRTVRNLIERRNGMFNCSIHDGVFYAVGMIPLKDRQVDD